MILYNKDFITVSRGNGIIELTVNGKCQGQAEASRPHMPVSKYMREIVSKINSYHVKTVLVIGGGAYIIPNRLQLLGMDVDVIEPELEIQCVAVKYFKASKYIKTYTAKAEDIIDNLLKYDCIILDAYDGFDPVPELYNEQFKNKMMDHLNDNGLLIIHDLNNGGVSEFKKCIQSK